MSSLTMDSNKMDRMEVAPLGAGELSVPWNMQILKYILPPSQEDVRGDSNTERAVRISDFYDPFQPRECRSL